MIPGGGGDGGANGSTRRNWSTVTHDMLSLAQHHPQFYLQLFIYVLEDIMMVLPTTSTNMNDPNHDYHSSSSSSSSSSTVVTARDIRQFKDILKGYSPAHDVESHHRPNESWQNHSNHHHNQSPTTLLEFLFQLVIQIFDATFHSSNHNHIHNGSHGEMEDSSSLAINNDTDGPTILLCIKAIRNAFTWTTMEFLGSSLIMHQMFQLMMHTVHRYHHHHTSLEIRYEIMKETFTSWKEFVTSCHVVSPPTTSTEQPLTTTTSSSIQSTLDPKLVIIGHMLECIHATQWLPATVPQSTGPQYYSCANNISSGGSSSCSIPNLVTVSPDPTTTEESSISSDMMEVIISVATLINTMALEILPLYRQEGHSCIMLENLFQQVFDLSIRTFAYDDIDVSAEILPFIVRLSCYMVESGGSCRNDSSNPMDDSQRFLHHIPLILNILYQQMKYPNDFSYGNDENGANDDDDDEAAEEIMFRTELCQVYKKLVSVAPSACLQFLRESLLALSTTTTESPSTATHLNLAAASTPDLEAMLRLFYVFCEGVRPAPGLKVVMRNEAFCNMLQTLHDSNITQHPHPEVLCLYYDNAVRYYPFYLGSERRDLLSKLLNAMTGSTGLQHPHPRVRSRCCYLFLKLVQVTITLLTPNVETAVTGILSLLNNPGLLLRADDTLYLFETIGLLLGKTGLEISQQQHYLRAVITPHVRTIESALAVIDQYTSGTSSTGLPESDDILIQNSSILSSSIAAITNLSKGFTNPSHEIAALLTETLHITLKVLQKLPSNENIRNKSMVLVQRMIVCVGQNILDTIPFILQLLVQWSTCDDILFVAQILNQLCIKFKQNAIPAIDGTIIPFLEKCQSLVPTLQDIVYDSAIAGLPPHIETEQLAIRKLSYVVLQHIVTNQVTGVLFSSVNIGHLEAILRLMYDGVICVPDPTVKKTCLRFFRALIEQAKTIPPPTIEANLRYEHGILVFIGENVIPKTLQFLITSSNRRQYINDANGTRVTAELGQLIYTFRQVCENDVEHTKLYQTSLDILKNDFQRQNIDGHLLQEQLQQAKNGDDYVSSIQNAIKEMKK